MVDDLTIFITTYQDTVWDSPDWETAHKDKLDLVASFYEFAQSHERLSELNVETAQSYVLPIQDTELSLAGLQRSIDLTVAEITELQVSAAALRDRATRIEEEVAATSGSTQTQGDTSAGSESRYSRLQTMTRCDSAGLCLAPITFDYFSENLSKPRALSGPFTKGDSKLFGYR